MTTPTFLRGGVDPARQESGRKWLSSRRIIICGLVRDSEPYLERTLGRIRNVVELFADYRILILENDSRDRTRSILLSAAQQDPKIQVLGCGINSPECRMNLAATERGSGSMGEMSHGRIAKMVHLRNQYLDHVRTHFRDWDLMAVWDLDGDGVLYLDGIIDSAALLASGPNVDGIAAQGFRVKDIPGGTALTYGDSYAYMDSSLTEWSKIFRALFLSIFPGYPYRAQRIDSAFNGFVLYRMSAINGHKYASWIDENEEVVCEHRGFHRGMNLWINPAMINVMLEY